MEQISENMVILEALQNLEMGKIRRGLALEIIIKQVTPLLTAEFNKGVEASAKKVGGIVYKGDDRLLHWMIGFRDGCDCAVKEIRSLLLPVGEGKPK